MRDSRDTAEDIGHDVLAIDVVGRKTSQPGGQVDGKTTCFFVSLPTDRSCSASGSPSQHVQKLVIERIMTRWIKHPGLAYSPQHAVARMVELNDSVIRVIYIERTG